MRRKPIHLCAAITEAIRFFALAFLAYAIGSLGSASVEGILRYAAVPQILFAAGFFFLWFDPLRYSAYRSLLLLGKIASILCLLPLAASVAGDPGARGLSLGKPALGLSMALLISALDLFALAVLFLAKPQIQAADGSKPIGQSPEDIERIEV